MKRGFAALITANLTLAPMDLLKRFWRNGMKKAMLDVLIVSLFLLCWSVPALPEICAGSAAGEGEEADPSVIEALNSIKPGTAPVAVVTQPVYHAGPIRQGTPLAHTFTIRNEGTADLVITRVKGG